MDPSRALRRLQKEAAEWSRTGPTASSSRSDAKGNLDSTMQEFTAFPEPKASCAKGQRRHPGDDDCGDEVDLMCWRASIKKQDGVFKGVKFRLSLTFSASYPISPPEVKFLSFIYHPNVHSTGVICVDVLKSKWLPSMNIRAVLLSVSLLLDEPNPTSPLNIAAAKDFKKGPKQWTQVVRKKLDEAKKGKYSTIIPEVKIPFVAQHALTGRSTQKSASYLATGSNVSQSHQSRAVISHAGSKRPAPIDGSNRADFRSQMRRVARPIQVAAAGQSKSSQSSEMQSQNDDAADIINVDLMNSGTTGHKEGLTPAPGPAQNAALRRPAARGEGGERLQPSLAEEVIELD